MSGDVVDNPTGWVARHIRRYDESDGTFNGHPALLLTTRGRRTGRLRRTALWYGRDGERYVLVATARHPAWYLNLVQNPAVVVQVGETTFAAVAAPATAAERPRLWRHMAEAIPKYREYRRKAGRDLAIVVVDPVSAVGG